ncbi:MAG: hypothetical protein LH660_00915 [Phormidesmis sp. CAN_BIN36]|nr:hypothetical protein [Phormidesmis sp. CAN_BIN36]
MGCALLLNSYAISGARSLADFYRAITPVKKVLMSVWGRSYCPAASTLSQFFGAIDSPAMEALRRLFKRDLEAQGLRVMPGIGLY